MGWIIAGAVIVFIMILLMTSVKVRFEYQGEVRLKINWYFIRLFTIPAVTRKQKRRDRKTAGDAAAAAGDALKESEKAVEKSGVKSEPAGSGAKPGKQSAAKESGQKPSAGKKAKPAGDKMSLSDITALVKLIWDSLSKPLRHMLKATRIYGFRLDIVCGGEDAAKAALNYGRTSAAAGIAAAFLESCFTMRSPEYYITVDFMSEETRTKCEFTAKLTLMAVLATLFWIVGRAVRYYTKRKDAARAVEKLRK